MASNNHTKLYHHTSGEAVNSIMGSGFIKQLDTKNGDTVFGSGVYANKMGPENSQMAIAKNNYGSTVFAQDQIDKSKVDATIEFTYDRHEVMKVDANGRDVYIIQNDIPVSNIVAVHPRNKDNA